MTTAGLLFDAVTGVLFVALGLALLVVPPRRLLKFLFGLYAAGLGALVLSQNLAHLLGSDGAGRLAGGMLAAQVRLVGSAAGLLAAAALLALAWRVSRRRDAPIAYIASSVAAVALLASGLLPQLVRPWDVDPNLTRLGSLVVAAGRDVALRAAAIAAALALALAARAAVAAGESSPRDAPRLMLLSLGVVPIVAFSTGDAIAYRLASGEAAALPYAILSVAGLFGVSLVWASVARSPAHRRGALLVAAIAPLLLLAGGALYAIDPSGNSGAAGAVRTASLLVLGYAVLRGELFGVAPRLNRGLRRGTVAIAFAAAFLVGGRLGDVFLEPPYDLLVSLASMAALLVALDPLRRAADRVTESADRAGAPLGAGTPGPLRPGSVILGRYHVEQLLGEGGEGATFLCHDAVLGRPVAAKALPVRAGLGTHLDEARRAAKLRHPNVVQVLDVAQDTGHGYILMEHVPGGNLARRLQRGPLPTAAVAELGDDLLSALAACHGAGLVHGDVKPENLLLDARGRIKLTDFGAARPHRPDATARADAAGLGTLLYMAPEQVRGQPATVATDLYAAGLVLAVAATGEHPLATPLLDDFTLRRALLEAPPRLDAVPPQFRPVVERSLAKEPGARFATAEEMRAALRSAVAAPAGI